MRVDTLPPKSTSFCPPFFNVLRAATGPIRAARLGERMDKTDHGYLVTSPLSSTCSSLRFESENNAF